MQAGGRRFDPVQLHHFPISIYLGSRKIQSLLRNFVVQLDLFTSYILGDLPRPSSLTSRSEPLALIEQFVIVGRGLTEPKLGTFHRNLVFSVSIFVFLA